MKKIANRILALIVALTVLLLPGAALANEQNLVIVSAGNFALTMGEETISLPVTLELGVGADVANARGMALVKLLASGQTAASAYGAVENGEVKLYLDGMEYGLYAPLEDLLAMAEAEMGGSVEELTESISPELESAITRLTTAAEALEAEEAIDEDALLAAMNVTMTDMGTEEITVFGEAMTAAAAVITVPEQDLAAFMNATSSVSPAFAEYWASYTELLNVIAEESGEELNLDEVMTAATIGAEGVIYTADTGMMAAITMTVSAEGESIEIPFTIAALETETTSAAQVEVNVNVDSETLYVSVITDETSDETGDSFNVELAMGIKDAETGVSDGDISLDISSFNSAEAVVFTTDVYALMDGEEVALSLQYAGLPAVSFEGSETYEGTVTLEVLADGMPIALTMDTGLTITSMPEGELLSLPGNSINMLEASDDEMEQFGADATTPLMQAVGVLMQDPTIAEMLSGLMG